MLPAAHSTGTPGTPDESSLTPLVSIVIPCRNERRYIAGCLDSILANGYPHERLEIIVSDGMSDDGTREILADYERRFPFIRRLDNPARTTPVGINLAIRASRGSLIMLTGAHSVYAEEYVATLAAWSEQSGADVVGGVLTTCPANNGPIARAIAIGMGHPLGVGNSHFRIGVKEPRLVDTVAMGCYRRDVFDRVGFFDEDLVRNQDDEFNLRLLKHRGRVLLVPDATSQTFARDSLARLWRMFYQYGYFKPLVARKLGRVMTVRQLVPGLFVLSLLLLGAGSRYSLPAIGLGLIGASYAAVCLIAAVRALTAGQRIKTAAALLLVFPTLHLSYGLGSLRGLLDFLILRRRVDGAAVPISR